MYSLISGGMGLMNILGILILNLTFIRRVG